MRGNTTQLAPPAYVTPPFPSLYWFIRGKPHEPRYLYHQGDIWRFTFFWTIIIYELVHVAASGYALIVQWKNWRFIWIVPLVYAAIAGVEAILAGSVVGLLLGAVYNAGSFKMSTWIPFIWSLINVLVLIVSSFSIQGGL